MITYAVNGKNIEVTGALDSYVRQKFGRFERFLPDNDITVYTKLEVTPDKKHKVEVTIPIGKDVIRAEEMAENMYFAVTMAEKTISRLLRKRKERLLEKHRQAEENIPEQETSRRLFDRVKRHNLSIISSEEAATAIDMVGHSFYVYKDAATGELCVAYRRRDNSLGKIVFDV